MCHTGVKLKSGLNLDVEEEENTQKQLRREGIQVKPGDLNINIHPNSTIPLIPMICTGKLDFFFMLVGIHLATRTPTAVPDYFSSDVCLTQHPNSGNRAIFHGSASSVNNPGTTVSFCGAPRRARRRHVVHPSPAGALRMMQVWVGFTGQNDSRHQLRIEPPT